jgi:hypothetical protein
MQDDVDRVRAEAARAMAACTTNASLAEAAQTTFAALELTAHDADAVVKTLAALREDAETVQRLTAAIDDGNRELGIERRKLVGLGPLCVAFE